MNARTPARRRPLARRAPLAAVIALLMTGAALWLGAAPRAAEPQAAAPGGPVILTIAGKISRANRGPLAPERDRLFAYRDLSFDRAMAFDEAALRGLPQRQARVNIQNFGEAAFSGPLLRDALAAAGASKDAAIRVFALDGYAADFTAADLEGRDWILALTRDGGPLGLGDLGPLCMISPSPDPVRPEGLGEARPVWSAFYIEIR